MRLLSLVSMLIVGAGCTVRVPRAPIGVTFSGKVAVRADVRGQVPVPVPPPPPPPAPAPAVALVGAPVVEFFGIPLDGAQDVVFVLDCSGSMDETVFGQLAQIAPAAPPPANVPPPPPPPPNAPPPPPAAPRKIDIARDELVDALRRLPAGTRLNVLFFNEGVDATSPGLFPIDDAHREDLAAFVLEQEPTGRTALAPAMRMAFLMNARRVVLLSDGLGNVGGDERSILRDAREAMHGGVRIDTIGLGRNQDASLLGSLASESGGLYQAF